MILFKCNSLFQTLPGLEQYSVKKYAEALESIPKALAENAGLKVRDKSITFLCLEEGNPEKMFFAFRLKMSISQATADSKNNKF